MNFLSTSSPRTGLGRYLGLVILSVLLAACGANGAAEPEPPDEGTPQDEAQGDAAAPETTDLSVGLIPIIDPGLAFIALDNGYFDDHGLNVELLMNIGGATNATALAAGEIHVGFGNYVTYFLAAQEGVLDLAILAEANRAVNGLAGLYALNDSGIAEPADLEGRRVAVNQVNNIATMTAEAVLLESGVDIDTITFVELPFPEMGAGLERGDFDAGWFIEPFVTTLGNTADVTQVIDVFSGPTDSLAVSGYYTTREFVDENPNTVRAFQDALEQAAEFAEQDPEAVRGILERHTELPSDVIAEVAVPFYPQEIDSNELQRVADLMLEAGYTDASIDVDEFIVD